MFLEVKQPRPSEGSMTLHTGNEICPLWTMMNWPRCVKVQTEITTFSHDQSCWIAQHPTLHLLTSSRVRVRAAAGPGRLLRRRRRPIWATRRRWRRRRRREGRVELDVVADVGRASGRSDRREDDATTMRAKTRSPRARDPCALELTRRSYNSDSRAFPVASPDDDGLVSSRRRGGFCKNNITETGSRDPLYVP
jgi:hypothetical protein